MLYILLREGNPDCMCGDEFVGFTHDKIAADLYGSIYGKGLVSEFIEDEHIELDARYSFWKKLEKARLENLELVR